MSFQIVGSFMLGKLRRLNAANLPERATIERPATPEDEQGGYGPTTWDTVATNVPARVNVGNITPREELKVEQTITQSLWMVWFRVGTDVRETDRIVIKGHYYYVSVVASARTKEAMIQCLCSRVD